MSFDDIHASPRFAAKGSTAPWRSPGQFYVVEAESFTSPEHADNGGLPLDRVVALRLLKFPFKDFWAHRYWYSPLDKHELFDATARRTELETLNAERERLLAEYNRLKEAGEQTDEIDAVVADGKRVRARIDELVLELEHPYRYAPLMHPEDTVPGMNEAGASLAEAVANDELIAVFCDYDVDGTTAGEVLRRALEPYGARLMYGWADAKVGFGVSSSFVREASEAGASTLVTLDCGSSASEAVSLAKSLGMRVVVVDHHQIEGENEADHHLNPNLYDPPTSAHTGAQLSWKLGAAVQLAKEGKVRDEHWREPLYLAGMGCYADMGSVNLHENRAFFWLAHEHPPVGIQELARELGEDPTLPGQIVLTQACLNLAKRSPTVHTKDVGALLAAKTAEEARPYVDKLLTQYQAAKIARKEIVALALDQTGRAQRDYDSGKIDRPHPDQPFAIAVIEDERYGDYIGYTGPVASSVSRETGKPAIVFIRNGDDVKFSGRNDSKVPVKLGDLIEDPAMKAACTVTLVGEDGDESEGVNLGGHEEVVSGRCKPENVEAVKEAVLAWASRQKSWFPTEESAPKPPFVQEKLVAPARLEAIESQARRLGPFSSLSQPVLFKPGAQVEATWNSEVQISIAGELVDLEPDPENEKYLAGKLKFDDGTSREVRYPADEPLPDGRVQWLLRVGKPGPYYLRRYAPAS